ncbi:hypothetical protein S7S_14165 [Isoalcanivorax pacificus W11-5]|uniref:Uncharacterized protein n=1 Tax=Isoalcanivorax pacificus W11-5 TaxID=391936 RepID=A0A0B4XR30_9GAMM|nr:hypothetical protein S7S_14165 [Isoalcanivorax pacificus W11-5]
MARRQQRIYMPQFRQQMVELVRLGRKYEDLGPEFGCTLVVDPAAVKRAERDELAGQATPRESQAQAGAGSGAPRKGDSLQIQLIDGEEPACYYCLDMRLPWRLASARIFPVN